MYAFVMYINKKNYKSDGSRFISILLKQSLTCLATVFNLNEKFNLYVIDFCNICRIAILGGNVLEMCQKSLNCLSNKLQLN